MRSSVITCYFLFHYLVSSFRSSRLAKLTAIRLTRRRTTSGSDKPAGSSRKEASTTAATYAEPRVQATVNPARDRSFSCHFVLFFFVRLLYVQQGRLSRTPKCFIQLGICAKNDPSVRTTLYVPLRSWDGRKGSDCLRPAEKGCDFARVRERRRDETRLDENACESLPYRQETPRMAENS